MKKILLFLFLVLPFPLRGQEAPFPQKGNIEITVLFPAGSSADNLKAGNDQASKAARARRKRTMRDET